MKTRGVAFFDPGSRVSRPPSTAGGSESLAVQDEGRTNIVLAPRHGAPPPEGTWLGPAAPHPHATYLPARSLLRQMCRGHLQGGIR